jgi:serine/threonine-protein kinase HipA
LVVVERDWSEIRFAEVLAETGIVDAVSLPGVQDKVSARMISVPVGRAGERFLLKLDPPEFPHVVINEAFFIELARSARVPSAHGSVVHDAEGRPGLLVRRFDRVAEPGGATRSLACEDACQVLGRWPADKYLVSYEQVVTALADRCPARPVALRALFQQLCYAWLTGNGDLHAKNASILATEDGEWRVAPAYDLPTTIPYGDLTMALPMSGRTSGLSRRQVLGFASEIGLTERAATAVLDELLERVIGLEERTRSGALPFGPDRSADLAAAFRYRRRQMLA